jgi:hypothetical protein
VKRLTAVVLLALVGVSGCGDDTVRIAFQPPAGARYAYRVEVESTTVTAVEGTAPVRRHEKFVLRAAHHVLTADGDSSRVEVRLRDAEGVSRRFVVRLDRAGQLTEVQRIEGIPARALGSLGLTEIFPAAAGAPPDSRLSPGDRWRVDDPVELPGQAPTRLLGTGRLSALGVVEGRDVATVESQFELTVRGTSVLDQGRFRLTGTQTTTSTSSHGLADGAVEEVTALTTGRFRLMLLPPAGEDGPEVPGTLRIEVRSKTRRVA